MSTTNPMSNHDPKRHPLPGDVLAKGEEQRKVLFKGQHQRWICAVEWERPCGQRGTCKTVQGWRRWASGATVVHRAE